MSIILIKPSGSGGAKELANNFDRVLHEYAINHRDIYIPPAGAISKTLINYILKINGASRSSIIIDLTGSIPSPSFLKNIKHYLTYVHCPEPYARHRILKSESGLIFKKRIKKIFECNLHDKLTIVSNSSFTKKLIVSAWNVQEDTIFVLHPCLRDDLIKKAKECDYMKKKNVILTIARIHRRKNLEILLKVAKHFPDHKFFILGYLQDRTYYKKLLNISSNEGLLNLKIIVNVNTDVKHLLLSFASIYLHPTLYENFGIAVVEALAYGCIPIVHKYSGAYIDILMNGTYGYGYKSINDIIEIINRLKRSSVNRTLLQERAWAFSYATFKNKVIMLLRSVLW